MLNAGVSYLVSKNTLWEGASVVGAVSDQASIKGVPDRLTRFLRVLTADVPAAYAAEHSVQVGAPNPTLQCHLDTPITRVAFPLKLTEHLRNRSSDNGYFRKLKLQLIV